MLTISKPLSASQARTYHAKEFASQQQNYWNSEGDRIQFTAPVDHIKVANRELGALESISWANGTAASWAFR
jgi:hypothetical protein